MGAPVGGETIGLASLRRVETLYSSKEPELAVRPTTLPGEPKQERATPKVAFLLLHVLSLDKKIID